jgi:sigma-E factor negative regulatory protein RseB
VRVIDYMRGKFRMAVIMTAIFACGASFSQQTDPAYGLMVEMINASQQLNYEGLVTYEKMGNLKSAKVLHLVRDAEIFEQIVSLNGPEGEFSNFSGTKECHKTAAFLGETSGLNINDSTYVQLKRSYSIETAGTQRIAGREATLLMLRPNDAWRYGYVVAIDKQSGLMLQSVLVSLTGKPMERFQFIEISVGGDLDSMEVPSGSFNLEADERADCKKNNSLLQQEIPEWQADWLPTGFVMTDSRLDEDSGQYSMVFTDGLAVLSVFVESSEASIKMPSFAATSGATVALVSKVLLEGSFFTVSVVGEIPSDTARRIIESVTRASDTAKNS